MSNNKTENTEPQEDLTELEDAFILAMDNRQNGLSDIAEKQLLAILQKEPRLAEPHLELAHLYLGIQKLDEAKIHIDQAIHFLENGGQWLDIPENELKSLAYSTKGEILRQIADQDEVMFGDEQILIQLLEEVKKAFLKARELDHQNEYSQLWGAPHQWTSHQKEPLPNTKDEDSSSKDS